MPRVRTPAIAVALLVAPIAGHAADVTGAWVIKGDLGPKFQHTLVCAFKADASTLSGPCIGAFGPVLKASGSLDRAGLTFTYLSDYQGNDFVTEYAGRPGAGGSVSGTIQAGQEAGAFSGSTVADWPDDHLAFWLLDSRLGNGLTWSLGCAFKASRRLVNGPCAAAIGPPTQATGTIEGASVSFAYDYDLQGSRKHIVYTGTVQPDGSLKGTVAQDGLSGAFTGRRRP